MAEYFKRQFLDFEQPIKELYEQIEENKRLGAKNPKMDYAPMIKQLEDNILVKRRDYRAFYALAKSAIKPSPRQAIYA